MTQTSSGKQRGFLDLMVAAKGTVKKQEQLVAPENRRWMTLS